MSVGLWQRVVAAQVPPNGKHVRIQASAEDAATLAEALGIAGVETLSAELELRPLGAAAIAVRGRVQARVVQTDVITLEPVAQDIDETVDVTLVPAADTRIRERRVLDVEQAPVSVEQDTYEGGRIDLGIILQEHVALALDPYPRAPGVEFPGHVEDAPTEADSPFAALARLKPAKD